MSAFGSIFAQVRGYLTQARPKRKWGALRFIFAQVIGILLKRDPFSLKWDDFHTSDMIFSPAKKQFEKKP